MAATNGVVFFANKIYQNFTKSSAPTWEDEDAVLGGAAVDSLGDAVAATELAFDILDTQRKTRIAVDSDDTHNTGTDATATWRFDLDLNSLQDIDFAITDNHDVRNAYDQEIKANIDIYHDANATFNGSTVLVPSKHFAGLIGKARPHLNFVTDDYVTKSNDADLNFGEHTDYTLVAIVRTSMSGANGHIISKGAASRYGMYIHSGGTLYTTLDDGATEINPRSTDTINDGEWHMSGVTNDRDSATGGQTYIDGVANGSAYNITAVGDIDSVAKSLALGIYSDDLSSGPFDGDIIEILIFNRALTAAEMLTLYNGWTHTPIPVADQWGSQAAKNVSACVNDNYGTFDGESATGFHAVSDGAATHKGGTADEIAVVSGKKYGVYFDLSLTSGTLPKYLFLTALGGSSIVSDSEQTSVDGENYFEFTCDVTATGVLQFRNVSTATEYTVSNLKIYDLGCVAEYHPDGINPGETTWYDSSSNNLDGTIVGATEKDCPTSVNGKGDFTLYEFTAVLKQYWFWQFNLDNNTADTDTSVGQIGLGKKFEVAKEPDLPVGEDHLYDGIYLSESQGGRRSSNERYGRRLKWELNWSYIPEAEKTNFETFLETIKGVKYPFWFTLNYDDNEPIFYWARLVNNPRFTQQAYGVYAVNLIIEEEI